MKFHTPIPRHELQRVHLHLKQPPASWPSILLVFPFAGRLAFWSGCLSLILPFLFHIHTWIYKYIYSQNTTFGDNSKGG